MNRDDNCWVANIFDAAQLLFRSRVSQDNVEIDIIAKIEAVVLAIKILITPQI